MKYLLLLLMLASCIKQEDDLRMEYGVDFYSLYETYQGYTGHTMSFMCASYNKTGKQITSLDSLSIQIDDREHRLRRLKGVVYAIESPLTPPDYVKGRKYLITINN